MSKWKIFKREVWIRSVTIEAGSLAEAMKIAEDDEEDNDDGCFEYSHTRNRSTWTAIGPDGELYHKIKL